jgi:hypothetical protein
MPAPPPAIELGDDEAAGEARGTGVGGVDGGKGAGHDQPPRLDEAADALEVSGTDPHADREGVGAVPADDRVQHQELASASWERALIQKPCTRMNAKVSPSMPNNLKLTQVSSS